MPFPLFRTGQKNWKPSVTHHWLLFQFQKLRFQTAFCTVYTVCTHCDSCMRQRVLTHNNQSRISWRRKNGLSGYLLLPSSCSSLIWMVDKLLLLWEMFFKILLLVLLWSGLTKVTSILIIVSFSTKKLCDKYNKTNKSTRWPPSFLHLFCDKYKYKKIN